MSAASPSRLFTRREAFGLAILFTGIFVAVIDNFIVFVAAPAIRSDLQATPGQIELIISGYLLAFAMGVITGGRLGDRFGRRRLFIVGFTAFTASSALCGFAPTAATLILARLVQGLSGAILMPQVLAILRVSWVDKQKRAAAFAWLGIVIGSGSVLGQILGGLIVDANLFGLLWRPIFLINIPVGVVATSLAPLFLPESRSVDRPRLDIGGSLLAAIGSGLMLYPLIVGRDAGWPVWELALLLTGLLVLVLFVVDQRSKSARNASPLIDTSLFTERSFSAGVIATLLFYATPSPLFLSLTYLIQNGFGDSPMRAALDFLPLALAFAVTSYFTPRLLRFGGRRVLVAGCAISAASVASMMTLCDRGLHLGIAELFPSLMGVGVGQGLFMTPITNVVISAAQERDAGSAAGLLTMMQRGGNALGVAVFAIPFFDRVAAARSGGACESSAHVAGFGVTCAWIALLLAGVTVMLFLLPADEPVAADRQPL